MTARSGIRVASRALGVVARTITLVGIMTWLTACGGGGGGGGGSTAPPPVTLSSITVGPSNATVAAGLTQQFTATGVYSDGSQKDLSSTATWASSATATATVSSAGMATGVAAGMASISATSNGVTGRNTLTVGPPNLVSVVISPNKP